jgi:hypothetical protein
VISDARFEAGDLASLDLDALFRLHNAIYLEATAVHAEMMDGDTPRVPVLSSRWFELSGRHAAYHAEMAEVGEEIARRPTGGGQAWNAGPAS